MTTRHILPGLRPEPLASYLAGLGLIRVLGEQADPDATAAWSADALAVTTTVEDIAAWLADSYVPTPGHCPRCSQTCWSGAAGPRQTNRERTSSAVSLPSGGGCAFPPMTCTNSRLASLTTRSLTCCCAPAWR
jgi:CRISPR-associated protein Csx17